MPSPPFRPRVSPGGVAFSGPPTSLLADATHVLAQMTDTLPPGTNGAVIGVATEAGWNAAVVHRVGDSFAVSGWIGKSWGPVTGGGVVRWSW